MARSGAMDRRAPTEAELRRLLGDLALALGDRVDEMNTHDVVAAVRPRVEAFVRANDLLPVDDGALRALANRWLSESAVAAALALLEDD